VSDTLNSQRGNTLVGIVIGMVIGLAAALAVAVYVTKVPVPFVNKNQGRTPEQDAAESKKNKDWDPNAPLYGKNPAKPLPPAPAVSGSAAPAAPSANAPAAVAPAPAASARAAAPASAPATSGKVADPLGDFAAAKAGSAAADPFLYFVQTGAFRTAEDAEAQRAKLSLMGIEAKVTEREQSGRQVFRVRVGPFDRKDDADRSKEKLEAGGIETALVRVQR
jgi:cell division protein FtsN